MGKTNYILLCLILIFFVGCANEQTDIFLASPAERMNKALKENMNILQSAENGWAMEYFATPKSAGYTLLMKFDSSGRVIVTGKNDLTSNKMISDSSLYEMLGDNGPVLTFNSYNKVLHVFSNPVNPDGYGLEGDYEFIVMKSTADQILLKGKKRGSEIRLNKVPPNITWEQYFADLDAMNTLLFNGAINPLFLVFGSDAFVAYNGSTHVFRITTQDGNPTVDGEDYGFIITPTGLRFHTAFIHNGKSAQTFRLSDDKQRLECTETGVIAHFEGPDIVSYYNFEISENSKWNIVLAENFMGAPVKAIFDRMNASLAATNRSLLQLAFRYNSARSSNVLNLLVKSGTNTINAYWDYGFLSNTNSLTYDFKNTYDSNGSIFYKSFDGFADMAALLSSTFILHADCGLNLSTLKFINASNPEIWFYVKRQ